MCAIKNYKKITRELIAINNKKVQDKLQSYN